MELFRRPLFIALVATTVYFFLNTTYNEPTEIHGCSHPEYERLHELFKNVSVTERGGLSMVLMKKGEKVIDLWAGYADPTANQYWKRDTLAVAFSTTKVYVGIIVSLLMRERGLEYTDQVSIIWPEFVQEGKQNTTFGDILDHKAGLLRFSRDFTMEESRDYALMGKIIEQTIPQWQPGSKMGYSGIAYGYLIDQLVMRLDIKGRTAAEYFNQKIRPKSNDTDFFLGLPEEENHRVARVTNPTLFASAIAHLSHPLTYFSILRNFFKHEMLAESSAKYPSFLDLMQPDVVPFNSPDVRSLPVISCNGIGTARAMAATLIAAANLLSDEQRNEVMLPLDYQEDFVLTKYKYYGKGFTYIRHPNIDDRFIVSFWGNGLQMVAWDPMDDTVFVVFRNGLKAGDNGRIYMEEMLKEAFHL